MFQYFHKIYKIGILRMSIYILHNKWTVRFELSKGWE